MKTKIKLVNQGCKNHPLWRLVVQGEKKNLKGRYIEHIGYWMPRHQRTYRRGMVLNKHKTRYWLGVGAQPTKGVIRVLEKFNFFPRYPVPFGSKSLYEKPKRTYEPRHFKDYFKGMRNPETKFKEMLRSQINLAQRNKLIQAEALDNLGAAEVDLGLIKTDDISSEEGDVFQRFEKFQELNKRFEKHRAENLALRGNDLRYNVYMKKMQKMVRMDVGLDVEAFKDYINNTKEFAKVNNDWEIFGKEDLSHPPGIFVGGRAEKRYASVVNGEDIIEKKTVDAQWAERTKRVQVLVIKLLDKGRSQIFDKDYAIIDEFASNPEEYLSRDGNLAIDLKKLYEKRKQDLADRQSMGVNNIEKVTDAMLKERGVSKREFALIKKFIEIDPEIFAVKEFVEASPFTYSVDLTKYEGKKIPQECKDILYRPKKMRLLYERYWQLASEEDLKDRDAKLERNKLRYHPRVLSKIDEEFKLMDRFVTIVDEMLEQREKTDSEQFNKERAGRSDQDWLKDELEEYSQVVKGTHPTLGFRRYLRSSGFEYEAEKIRHQLKHAGFCTKSQLDYLMLYAEYEKEAGQARLKDIDLKNVTVVKDKDERKTDLALAQINQLLKSLRMDYRHSDYDKNQSRAINDALKKLDLTKLESKDLTLESIAKLTGLKVEQLRGDIPNRRFREMVDQNLQAKLKYQVSANAKLDEFIDPKQISAEQERQRDEANKYPFAEPQEDSFFEKDARLSKEQEEFLQARLNALGIEDKNARAKAIQQVRNELAREQVTEALKRERSRLMNQKGRGMLSDELRAKFDLLDGPADFTQRSAILSWAVDEMRSQVLDHLELSGFMDKLSEVERVDLIDELNQIQSDSSEQLFKLHQDQKNGTLVEENEYLQPLIHQIEKLRDKVSLAAVEADLLKMMQEHNQKVDEFTRKFNQQDLLVIDELRKTDLFESKLDAALPEFHNNELRVSAEAHGFNLDQELRQSGDLGYPNMATWSQEKIDAAENDFDLVKYQLENICVTMTDEEVAALQHKFSEHEALRIMQDSYVTMPNENDEQEVEKMVNDLALNMTLSNRLGLEWDKLFQGRGGGYDLETLTKALERIKKDRENGITFFEGENTAGSRRNSKRMQERLMAVLEKRRADASAKAEAAQEGEPEEKDDADEQEEGEKIPTVEENLINQLKGDENDTQIMKEVIQYFRDEMKAEAAEDGREFVDIFSLKDEEYQVLYKMFIEDRGIHLQLQWEQEDEEHYQALKAEGKQEDPEERRALEQAREEELTEWLKVKFEGAKVRKYRPALKPHEARHKELMAENPYYAKVVNELIGNDYFSYADNAYVPDIQATWDELERIESNLGRYPHGFRHYENYHNYLQKFPKASLLEYQEDMNSQITFDEYLVLKQAHALYELKYDPQVMHQVGLFDIDSEDLDPLDKQRLPDRYVRSEEFRDEAKEEYHEAVRNALLDRSHYTKVEALENFTNLYEMGRGPVHRPTANEYLPMPINILPRPKFRDMDKEDEIGDDFSYRNKDGTTVAPAIMPMSTLKPQKFEPELPKRDCGYDILEIDRNRAHKHMRKWSKYRRLSKSRRTNFTFVQMSMPWRNFGSLVEREDLAAGVNEQVQTEVKNYLSAPLMRPFLNSLGNLFFNLGAFNPKK